MDDKKQTKRVIIEEGWEVIEESTELMPGVTLIVYDGTEATLSFSQYDIDFRYDDEAKQLFGRFEECTAMELLAVLSRDNDISTHL